uniref:Uncharacterized protein n=1 Tax=viral metagenome TaxID=1070528 RepID=A0A6M3JV29_9ZZZZ
MAKIRVTIKGELGQISASRFLTVVDHSLHLLGDLDRHFSASRLKSLSWVISGLGEGNSTYMDLESRVKRGEEDIGIKVYDAFIGGLGAIEKEHVIPKYFNTAMLVRLRKMTKEFGRDGIQEVHYSGEKDKKIRLDIETEKTLDELIGIKYKVIGSIEGKIELISIRKKSRRFDIFQSVNEKAVTCTFPEEIEQDVFRGAEQRFRVVVSGLISYNAKDEPRSISVKAPLRFLKREVDLPTIEDMRGLDRNITEGLSTEDYVRSLRE